MPLTDLSPEPVPDNDGEQGDVDNGEESSDSESRRMVLRSQSGKGRKRRWTSDFQDETEDAFDDDDESGSYRGTSRRSRPGKVRIPF